MTAPDRAFSEVTLPDATSSEMTLPEMTSSEMTWREMTWRDIPALIALEPELFADDAWSEQTWWAELAGRPRRCYVVGDHGGTVVGYAGMDCGGEIADVMTIAVAPAAQGQGLGTALMRWLVAQARRAGPLARERGGRNRNDAHLASLCAPVRAGCGGGLPAWLRLCR